MVEVLVSARKALEPTSYPRLQDFLGTLQSFEAYLRSSEKAPREQLQDLLQPQIYPVDPFDMPATAIKAGHLILRKSPKRTATGSSTTSNISRRPIRHAGYSHQGRSLDPQKKPQENSYRIFYNLKYIPYTHSTCRIYSLLVPGILESRMSQETASYYLRKSPKRTATGSSTASNISRIPIRHAGSTA